VNVQGGADFKVADGLAVGPLVSFSVGEYANGSLAIGYGDVAGFSIPDKALHEWLTFSVRAVYDP
jgi:hypothetical protein